MPINGVESISHVLVQVWSDTGSNIGYVDRSLQSFHVIEDSKAVKMGVSVELSSDGVLVSRGEGKIM